MSFNYWIIGVIILVISILKDKTRTVKSMKLSRNMMKNMMGEIIAILFLIGLILTLIPPTTIQNLLGGDNLMFSVVSAALLGSITLIPAFVAFPLAGSLVNSGASIVPIVAFLTTLTMVGVVTFSLEKKEFGFKFTLYRNLLSFIFAILIAIVVGGLI
ncbi:permease [Helicovermis profundi]|uniref:Permease n=1 Tax=Helicovermis profundi TaxID=3065157 RepID=A0AAU9E4P3_9FIRM|nr:hypothetical protein HLPR_19220 [Clostridia bacterium S502]